MKKSTAAQATWKTVERLGYLGSKKRAITEGRDQKYNIL